MCNSFVLRNQLIFRRRCSLFISAARVARRQRNICNSNALGRSDGNLMSPIEKLHLVEGDSSVTVVLDCNTLMRRWISGGQAPSKSLS